MLWTAPHPASECHDVVAVEAPTIQEEPSTASEADIESIENFFCAVMQASGFSANEFAVRCQEQTPDSPQMGASVVSFMRATFLH